MADKAEDRSDDKSSLMLKTVFNITMLELYARYQYCMSMRCKVRLDRDSSGSISSKVVVVSEYYSIIVSRV